MTEGHILRRVLRVEGAEAADNLMLHCIISALSAPSAVNPVLAGQKLLHLVVHEPCVLGIEARAAG